jgi:hypothetical protein
VNFQDSLRLSIALGLTIFLVLLRFDSDRIMRSDYFRSRSGWVGPLSYYGLVVLFAIGIAIILPRGRAQLFLAPSLFARLALGVGLRLLLGGDPRLLGALRGCRVLARLLLGGGARDRGFLRLALGLGLRLTLRSDANARGFTLRFLLPACLFSGGPRGVFLRLLLGGKPRALGLLRALRVLARLLRSGCAGGSQLPVGLFLSCGAGALGLAGRVCVAAGCLRGLLAEDVLAPGPFLRRAFNLVVRGLRLALCFLLRAAGGLGLPTAGVLLALLRDPAFPLESRPLVLVSHRSPKTSFPSSRTRLRRGPRSSLHAPSANRNGI